MHLDQTKCKNFLSKLNFNKDYYQNIFTSGEAALNSLKIKIIMVKNFIIWSKARSGFIY